MKRKGFTLIELLVVIAIIALLMSILMPALQQVRVIAARVVCGSNCKAIGTGMMMYASDSDDSLPVWGREPNDYSTASVTKSLFLLVRKDYVTVDSFICKGEGSRPTVVTRDYTPRPLKLITDYDDFGGSVRNSAAILAGTDNYCNVAGRGGDPGTSDIYNAGTHCGYSYHSPNQGIGVTFLPSTTGGPGFAILADKNPYIKDQSFPTAQRKNISAWISSGADAPKMARQNSFSHKEAGQNVLFADGHVEFTTVPTVGIEKDNIYTYWNSLPFILPSPSDPTAAGNRNQLSGTIPIYKNAEAKPKDARDSLLLSEEWML